MKRNKMKVYLVKQTQPAAYYDDKTIYACTTKEKAREYCRKLNKRYGYGAQFNESWDFVLGSDSEYCHYYDWECMNVDESLIIL